MNKRNDQFEERWKRFEVNIHGKLLARMKNQPLTLASANMALKEASEKWFTPYDTDGAWLSKLCREEAVKGEAVKSILKNEIRFTKEVTARELPKAVTYGVPVAASILCGGIANRLGAAVVKQVVAAVLPSAVLFPVMKTAESGLNEQGKKDMIKGYLKQLEVYKQNITRLLSR